MELDTDLLIEQAQTILPKAPRGSIAALVLTGVEWGISTPAEIASFLAQLSHESCGLTVLEENLNYSVGQLMRVWPNRFPSVAAATPYSNNPEKLANFVYSNRLGNGPLGSGDGWLYHGRGFIQLTGKKNYSDAESDTGLPLLSYPEMALETKAAAIIAAWYWQTHNLDEHDDDADARAESRIINGGELGLADRQQYLDKFRKAFGV